MSEGEEQEWSMSCRKQVVFFYEQPTEKSHLSMQSSQFCCNLAALNFDTLLGFCCGNGVSGTSSSCFLSSIVGRAGGVMVRWGTPKGIGSFSTTVPEKAYRRQMEGLRLNTRHNPYFTWLKSSLLLLEECHDMCESKY